MLSAGPRRLIWVNRKVEARGRDAWKTDVDREIAATVVFDPQAIGPGIVAVFSVLMPASGQPLIRRQKPVAEGGWMEGRRIGNEIADRPRYVLAMAERGSLFILDGPDGK